MTIILKRSDLQHPASNIQHLASSIQHPTSNIQHQTSNIQHQTSNINRPSQSKFHPHHYVLALESCRTRPNIQTGRDSSTASDFAARDFNQEVYDRQFMEHNVIIKASSRDVSYPEHRDLSRSNVALTERKTIASGKGFIRCTIKIILSSTRVNITRVISFSEIEVQSFTLNFTEELQSRVTRLYCNRQQQPGHALRPRE